MKKISQKINLAGRWEVVCFYIRPDRQAEGTLQVFDAGSRIWEFHPDGHLIETAAGGESRMSYSFSPESRTLYIDRRDFEPDGAPWTRREEVFRATQGDDDIRLYDFEDTTGEEFIFRQIMLRRPM